MRSGGFTSYVRAWIAAATASVASASCGTTLPTTPPDAGQAPSEHAELASSDGGQRAQRIEFSNGRGRLVSAMLLAGPRAVDRRLAGIVVARDVGGRAEDLLAEGRALSAAGAVVLIPDWALGGEGWPSDDVDLWQCATEEIQRSFDALTARADVDQERLAFIGTGFGASVGAILATTDPRIRALALVEPEGDSRRGFYSSARRQSNLGHPRSLTPSERLHEATAHSPVLIQFGIVERDSFDGDAVTIWESAVTESNDQVHWYESAHEPDAIAARRSFLASHLNLPLNGGR